MNAPACGSWFRDLSWSTTAPVRCTFTPGFHLTAALLLGVLSGCSSPAPEAHSPAPAERPVPVAAVEIAPRDLSLGLQVTGSIEPIRQVRVAARTSGILETVRVEEGDRVAAGALLARFDVAEQQAELTRARTLLEHAEAAYRRAGDLRERQLISEVDYENTRADAEVARSEVRLWETRTSLGTVRSPVAGVITQKFVEAGDAVSSGNPLFTVADVSTLVVRVGVSGVHAAQLSVGQPVRVSIDAMPGETWTATIRRIFPAADPDSRLHPVEFALARRSGANQPVPGYLARIDIDLDRRTGVLAVPNESLLASTGQAPFVFVIDGDRLARRDVVPGVSREDWTEIAEGLEPGELVVGSNPSNLREGMLVRVTERLSPPSDES